MQDNQTIIAADLNNIAIDLGAGTFSKFTDDSPFAITELNSITADIVGKGILTTDSRCKCTLNDNNTVTVGTGIIVFSDGCKIRITEQKILTIENTSVKNYVFAEHSGELDSVILKIGTELTATDGIENIVLCEIENGILTDKREICVANCSLNAATTQTIEINETIDFSKDVEKVLKNYNVNGADFNYIIYSCKNSPYNLSLYDIKNGESFCFFKSTKEFDYDISTAFKSLYRNYYNGDSSRYDFEINFVSLENGVLSLEFYGYYNRYSNGYRNITETFTGTLILC